MSVTQHLVFDPANAADSANVGAFVRAGTDGTKIGFHNLASADWLNTASALFDGAGTAITSTGGALDVNIKTSAITLSVDLNGIYNVGTNPTPDNVGLIGFVRGATPGLADQTFTWTGATATSSAVVAANVHGMDVNAFGMGFNGTTWDRLTSTSGSLNVSDGGGSLTVDGSVSITGTVAVTQSTSPWVVSATDLDIRDLVAATDAVSAWTKDGTGNAIGSTTGALNVYVTGSGALTVSDAALANTAIANGATAIGTSLVSLVGSPTSGRKYLLMANNANKAMYIGTTGTTTSTGYPMFPGQQIELRAGASIDLKVISTAAAQDARYLELA